jgi:two-component system, sensor histidine kinase and response regulator
MNMKEHDNLCGDSLARGLGGSGLIASQADAPRRKLILIVDDDHSMARLEKVVLTTEGRYLVFTVNNSARALDFLRVVKVDLVLLDVMIPRMDGFCLYDTLKANPATANIPVIFLSAINHKDELSKRNITHYIQKPFDISDLLDRVAQALVKPGTLQLSGSE